MIFLQPLGLLGLIGVPIIVLIYILKNKFHELIVSSTYLWTLSEKFFKRRNPLSGLTGIISLILQILAVIIGSLIIARPIFILPDSAGEYCFVLDGSGSMSMVSEGESRFDRAKDQIDGVIKDASLGSSYTLILCADEATVVYERVTDKKVARDMLEELSCSAGESENSDALVIAQRYFDNNPSFSVYLATDQTIANHDNVELLAVGSDKDLNSGLFEPTAEFFGGELTVNAKAISYGANQTLKVALYLDGSAEPAATKEIVAVAGEETPVSLTCGAQSYTSYRLAILNEDALAADNEMIGYNLQNETSYSILVVSETPFFFQAALDALTDATVDTVSPDAYKGESDYGLYIFDSFTPDVLPDAAVWLINCGVNVDDSGFGTRGIVTPDEPVELVKSESTASTAQMLLDGIYGKDIYVAEYIKYGGMYTRFTTLFSYDANPLIFAGVNGLGNREVVVGFDLHKADFSLSTDFVALMGNLLTYSCPPVIEKAEYVCGEQAQIHMTANIKNVKTVAPDGTEIYLDSSADMGTVTMNQVGTYTVSLMASGIEKTYLLYSSAPEGESDPSPKADDFSLAGEQKYERTDGEFDPMVILFVCLALVLTADWMVYCYEKYQLR